MTRMTHCRISDLILDSCVVWMRRHYKWPEPINNMRKMQFAFADFFSEKRHGRLFQSFLKIIRFGFLKRMHDSRGSLMADHVHSMISSPSKYAVSQVICFIKGKSSILIARTYLGRWKILRVRIFGQGDIMLRQWLETRKGCMITSTIRKRKTGE